MNNRAKFISGDIKKHLIAMSLPSLIAIFTNLTIQAADMYFIARLGKASLTAISFVLPIMNIIFGINLGLAIATSATIALLIGANNFKDAKQFASVVICTAFIIALVIATLGLILFPFPFNLLGVKSFIIMQEIHQFVEIWYISLLFSFILFICDFILRAHGSIKISSSLFILVSLLNLFFDPILIFGLGPFPALGIAGAAWSGMIARVIVLFIVLTLLIKQDYLSFKADKNKIKPFIINMLSYFIPASLTNFIPPISVAITTYLLATISTNAVAAFGLASSIQAVSLVPFFALSGSINPVVAQNFGAKQFSRIAEGMRFSILLCFIWGSLVSIILFLSKTFIIDLFTQNYQIIRVANYYFDIVPISYMGWGIVMMTCAYFNGCKKPINSTIISFVRMILLFVPLAFIFKWLFSYIGIFIALNITNLSIGLLCLFLLRKILFETKTVNVLSTN